MILISVNIGQAQKIEKAKPGGTTGIFKRPIVTPVLITSQGLVGDAICDTKHHGGIDQAVYVYGEADYQWWNGTLGQALDPGTFGENLTISELESANFSIGDRLLIGEAPTRRVILEVTAPRLPCVTLAARMGNPDFIKQFRDAERPGFYCRVIKEGQTQVGDTVSLERYPGETVTVLEMFREYYVPDNRETTIRRYLASPIAIRSRREKEQQLQELLQGK